MFAEVKGGDRISGHSIVSPLRRPQATCDGGGGGVACGFTPTGNGGGVVAAGIERERERGEKWVGIWGTGNEVGWREVRLIWELKELHSMLEQKETRLKNQGTHFIHLVSHQGVGKKYKKLSGKGIK